MKRAKKIIIKKVEYKAYEYKCPACKSTHIRFSWSPEEIIRFRCYCGQELIIKEIK